jgi:hypothetical protein
MVLRKSEDTANWERKQEITMCGEMALEGAVGLS